MTKSYQELKSAFKRVLLKLSFSEERAELCASIFAANSRDGVYSHGLNRFPVFVEHVQQGMVSKDAEPELLEGNGVIEHYDGHFAPGMYNATMAMNRAIALAKDKGMGCVTLKNTNHWMRGGTYGWQAAEAGCIGICCTNTIANMPPYGGKLPRLGNNPLVIAVPGKEGHVVLDMAMSQFSYGKLQDTALKGKELPVPGGYDENGKLSHIPADIMKSQRALPIGFWKGSGLSFVLDVLLTALTGGRSVAEISKHNKESGLSQLFICFHKSAYHDLLLEQIIEFTKTAEPATTEERILYPGENTLATRRRNEENGIPVNEEIWQRIQTL